jgi:anaerobic magnesium-protoporphyrin IX monomethyl ester cyclase
LRITFVYPDFESLGLGYLMSVCRTAGHEVEFIPYSAEDPYFDTKNKHLSFSAVAQAIIDTRPQVVAFSSVTDNYRYQLQVASRVKDLLPGAMKVFGGVHPTAVPERVIRRPEVDAVAIGEAEISFPAFLRACSVSAGRVRPPSRAVRGFVFKKGRTLVGRFEEGPIVSDLDSLPFPSKDAVVAAMKDTGSFYSIMTSRGCPFKCSYCFNSYCMHGRGGRSLRQRSVDNVLKELAWAQSRFDVKYVMFIDDCFTTNTRWLTEFCPRYRSEVGLPFWCLTHPLYLNGEKIKTLKLAGCNSITIGVQSLSEEINARILNRQSDRKKIAEDIRGFKDHGILVQVDHILGIPEDSLDVEEEAVRFYSEHKPDILSVFWLTYYPKVAILDTALDKGILTARDIDRLEEGLKVTPGNFHLGGSLRDSRKYYAISFLLNYVPLLPRFLIRLLVKTRLYRGLVIRNFYLAVALPRVLISLKNKRDIIGRSNLVRFINKWLPF